MTITADTFTNYATSTVQGGVGGSGSALNATDTSLLLPTGDGSKFPSVAPFMLQFGAAAPYELAKCTARSGDTLTLVRAQEGTTAATWAYGTQVEQVATAGNLTNLWSALNSGRVFYAQDYGAKNDGSTDDTTAIQAAINACQASGKAGTVVLGPNTSIISAPLTVASTGNIQIIGMGWGSQLQAASGFTGAAMLHVQSPGTQYGFVYGVTLREFFLNGNNVAGLNGIQLDSTYHALVEHVRIRYCLGISLYFNGATNAFGAYNYVVSCTITDGGAGTGLKTSYNEWLTVTGSSFVTFNSAGGYGAELTNYNCIIEGSQFDNCDTALYMSYANRNSIIGCQFDRAGTRFIDLRGCQACSISGCSFNSRNATSAHEAIYVNDPNNQDNVVVGCTMEPYNPGWAYGQFSYFINESGNTGSPGNLYSNNATAGVPLALVTGTARNNHGYNPALPLVPPAAPVPTTASTGGSIPAGVYGVIITFVNYKGESLGSVAGSVTTSGGASTITIPSPAGQFSAYGWYAYVTQAGGSTYYRQQAAGSPTALNTALTLTATPTTTGATPPGSNTTAPFSQPAVPASGTAFQNTYGVDCEVYVAGGTVSAITVNGVTTGATSGLARIAARATITLTYTAAPTWVWIGE